MDVSTRGVSYDSGKLVRGGGAPLGASAQLSPGVYQIQGVKNDFSMGGRRAAHEVRWRGAGVGGAATWARLQPRPRRDAQARTRLLHRRRRRAARRVLTQHTPRGSCTGVPVTSVFTHLVRYALVIKCSLCFSRNTVSIDIVDPWRQDTETW